MSRTAVQPDRAPALKRSNTRLPWLAAVVGLGVRLAAFVAGGDVEPQTGIERSYFSTAAALLSGYGFIMHTVPAAAMNFGFQEPTKVNEYLRAREAAGGRVDRQHPFPKSPEHWVPATLHPHGYSALIAGVYALGNYTRTLWSLRLLQIVADALACVFVFIFARNVFDGRIGRIAAWLYALCPPAIFLSLGLLLPDAFQGFFLSLVLALASFAISGKPLRVVLGGVVLGVSGYFRTENVLLPPVLFLAFWATGSGLLGAVKYAAALAAPALVVLLPQALWMKSRAGEFRFTSANAGGVAYSSIGEDASNPWGIVYRDEATEAEARKQGFRSAWAPDANGYFMSRFIEYLRTYPVRYMKWVLFHRLPFALATPYGTWQRSTRDEFTFTKYRVEEGLSRWGVVRKYPFRVLRYMGPQIGMMLYSGMLTLCVIGVALLRRRDWRRLTWILLPWGSTVFTIVMLKGIEPRNLAPTLIPALVAASVLLAVLVDRRRPQAPAMA